MCMRSAFDTSSSPIMNILSDLNTHDMSHSPQQRRARPPLKRGATHPPAGAACGASCACGASSSSSRSPLARRCPPQHPPAPTALPAAPARLPGLAEQQWVLRCARGSARLPHCAPNIHMNNAAPARDKLHSSLQARNFQHAVAPPPARDAVAGKAGRMHPPRCTPHASTVLGISTLTMRQCNPNN